MKNKIAAMFVALFMFAGLNVAIAAPAQAHISTCIITPKVPKKDGSLLRAEAPWACETPISRHSTYWTSEVQVLVLVERWGPDSWLGIPPSNKVQFKRTVGANRATVPCLKGTHVYKTLHVVDTYGAHGVKRKTKRSPGETTITC